MKTKIFIIAFLSFSFIFLNCSVVNAQSSTTDPLRISDIKSKTGLSDKSIKGTLESVINAILWIVGTLSLLMIIAGGVVMIVAGDNRDLVQRAQQMVTFAIVGLVICLVAYGVVIWVFDILAGSSSGGSGSNSGVISI